MFNRIKKRISGKEYVPNVNLNLTEEAIKKIQEVCPDVLNQDTVFFVPSTFQKKLEDPSISDHTPISQQITLHKDTWNKIRRIGIENIAKGKKQYKSMSFVIFLLVEKEIQALEKQHKRIRNASKETPKKEKEAQQEEEAPKKERDLFYCEEDDE